MTERQYRSLKNAGQDVDYTPAIYTERKRTARTPHPLLVLVAVVVLGAWASLGLLNTIAASQKYTAPTTKQEDY